MPHTKRSPAFQDRINALKRGVQHLIDTELKSENPACTAFEESILEVLDKYTTDSPCIMKAADDEPIFVLRAQDEMADGFVVLWADKMFSIAANLTECAGEIYEKIRAKAWDAVQCAGEMRQFPNRKRPD